MKPFKSIIASAALLLLGGATALPANIGPAVTDPFAPGARRSQNIEVTTPAGTTAIQFTMTLPDGFSLSSKTLTLDKTRATNHLYRMNEVEEGMYRCVIYSNANTEFAKTEGALFSVPLKAAATTPTGDFPLEVSNVTVSDAQGNETPLADATVMLPVRITPTGITVNPSNVEIYIGEEAQLSATVTPAGADQAVIWQVSSYYSNIISVDDTGKITGLGAGTATIYVRVAANTTLYKTVNVTIKAPEVSSISVEPTSLTLRKGDEARLNATVLPENAGNKKVTWSTSSSSIVWVNSSTGAIEARRAGTATITATSSSNSAIKATCEVTVLPPLTTRLTMSPSSASMTIGDNRQFQVSITPSDAVPTVKWTVSDASLAHVDDNGRLTALAAGTVTLTASATDGSDVSASASITINRPQGTAVNMSKTSVELRVGQETEISASVEPANANSSFRWTTSNGSVATLADLVASSTKIIANSKGTAFITATTTDGSNLSARCVVTVLPPLTTSLALSSTGLTMSVGSTETLKATVSPTNAEANPEWHSSNTAVATVDQNGRVVAVGLGKTDITATATDGSGVSATCTVSVNSAPITSLKLEPTTLTLAQSDPEVKLTAIIEPSYATLKTLEWSSSNPAVATVNNTGMVTPKVPGNATITAKTTDGSNLSATCMIIVTADVPQSVTIEPATVSLTINQTYRLTATVSPSTASQQVSWESSDQAVATVDANGIITAVSDGSATITATSAGNSAATGTCVVEVLPAKVEEIVLSTVSLDMSVGETAHLIATVKPDYAKVKEVSWSSSDPEIVSVDNGGNIVALSLGSAAITASATDGSDVCASCTINVNFAPVTSLALDHTALTLIQTDEPVKLTATVTPDFASNKELNWTSSNTAVAEVSADGIVTPIAPGSTVITVRTTDGSNLSATCTITVIIPSVETITVTPETLDLEIGESATLVATVEPAAALQAVDWISSDPAVATVSAEGVVTALAAGSAIISAMATDGSDAVGACTVTVAEPPITEIKVEEIILDSEAETEVGSVLTLTATVLPENADNKVLKWKSSKPEIAEVNADGKIFAIEEGVTLITASATDGSEVSSFCMLTVKAKSSLKTVEINGQEIEGIYNLMGLKVSNPGSGLYIVKFKNGTSAKIRL